MYKKENRISPRQAASQAALRSEQNRRLEYAAVNPIQAVLQNLGAALGGLDPKGVAANRAQCGSNKVTHEKNLWPGVWQMPLSTPSPPFSSFWPLYPP